MKAGPLVMISEGCVLGDIGDERLALRGGLQLAGMVARTRISLRRLAGDRRSGIGGFSRFLANPRVTVAALLDGWNSQQGLQRQIGIGAALH